jgi:hypothetical protein
MKKLLFMFTVLLAFCSCAKDYPQLVKDKAELYKNEGKIILNQSNDSTGKEHYIVYADVQNQIIGVDTLGDGVREIHLGKKKEFNPELKVKKGEGMKVAFYELSESTISLTKDGKLLWDKEKYNISDVYKDKYLVCKKEDMKQILLLDQEEAYHVVDMYEEDKINTDGSIDFDAGTGIYMLINEDENYEWPSPDNIEDPDPYYIDRYHTDVIVKVKILPNGEIIPSQDYADWGGIHVPFKDFATWETFEPYVLKVVEKEKYDNQSYWNCTNCGRIVKSETEPENSMCNARDFFSGRDYMKLHHWVNIGKAGPNKYQCGKCGQRVETDDYPAVSNCPEGSGHVWEEI